MTDNCPLRVAVIEDDPFLGPFLEKVVRRTPRLKLTSLRTDGSAALAALPEEAPDVILADLSLPKVRGARLLKLLKTKMPKVEIVVLTGCSDSETLLAAVRAGASGYLCKPSSPAEIINAILQAAQHRHRLNQQAVTLIKPKKRNPETTPFREWSRREMEVLTHVSEGKTNEEVALAIGVSTETVRSHLKRVYQKLGVKSRTEAAVLYLADLDCVGAP